jgi:hypothetical protein
MKTKKTFQFLIISSFTLLLFSCDKYHTKRLSGTYACSVDYHYWDMTPVIIDTMYNEDLEIAQDGKYVLVLGTKIHIDSLWKEKQYMEGDIHGFLQVLFKNDSVYITKSSGGMGGNGTIIYEGIKK